MTADNESVGPSDVFSISTWRVERWARLGSTNDRARELAVAGHPGRQWIIADEQTAGRGRLGRTWNSPTGNLYASALLIDPCSIELGAQIGFVAGVSILRAVRDLGATEARLKWPNDLLVDGAKLAGLLVEGLTTPARRFAAIVGIGVNVGHSPEVPAYPTTHLHALVQRPVAARQLFERLAIRFDETLAIWAHGAGFATVRELWLQGAAGLGGPIRVNDSHGAREGVFAGLDASGRLMLRRNETVEIVESGDLSLILPPA